MYKDMNAPANRMSKLLNKIERRLGLLVIDLPEQVNKDTWPEIIEEDSMPVFSRYFPYKITTIIDDSCKKDGFYFIDKDVPAGSTIIGVRDIDWEAVKEDGVGPGRFRSYGHRALQGNSDYIAAAQVTADYRSLFSLGIYPEFLPPNKIRLEYVTGTPTMKFGAFPLEVFIVHPMNLMTISPTMMGIFEDLCTADIATFLYHQLKYFDETDTAYLTLNLRLEALQEWAGKRDDIIRQLDEAHTSTANEYQPIMFTIV